MIWQFEKSLLEKKSFINITKKKKRSSVKKQKGHNHSLQIWSCLLLYIYQLYIYLLDIYLWLEELCEVKKELLKQTNKQAYKLAIAATHIICEIAVR